MDQAVHDLDPSLRYSALRPINIRRLSYGRGPLRLFRILMSNACVFNCFYCPMRRDRNLPRVTVEPDVLVRVFMAAYRKQWVDGLFVTTAIPDHPVRVMDRIVKLLEILRFREKYRGYIHVKVMPGADEGHIERVVRLADRVSVNLEAPCGTVLNRIAPQKRFDKLEALLVNLAGEASGRWMHKGGKRKWGNLRSGVTTQFVVGAGGESDRMILHKVAELYRLQRFHHAHYAAFRPIRETPFENLPEIPSIREHRLYQADYLIRWYGFSINELVFDHRGALPLYIDPKTAWARAHPEHFPVDILKADFEGLIRVPGIGLRTARRILSERKRSVIRDGIDLKRIGIRLSQAAPFITIGGKRVGSNRWLHQPFLTNPWEAKTHRTYEFSPGTFR